MSWRHCAPRQWVKNLLVFAPVIGAHETRPESWLLPARPFVALSVCASGAYLLNDLLDLPHDRRQPVPHCVPTMPQGGDSARRDGIQDGIPVLHFAGRSESGIVTAAARGIRPRASSPERP